MLQDASCSNQPHRLVRVNNDLGANYMIKGDYAKALEQYQQTFDVSLSNTTLRRLLNNQITDLIVEIKDERTAELSDENKSSAFPLILSLCKRLRDLTFCEQLSNQGLPISIFKLPSTSCMSSTLTKLKIDVNTFDDCLYLLDGRFEYLSTLIVDIVKISISRSKIDNTVSIVGRCISGKHRQS
ncbi:unnamed protein product [Rotaria sp. Silwood2]|nr:unnamed protein product [Rotaria sp. Silwood2]